MKTTKFGTAKLAGAAILLLAAATAQAAGIAFITNVKGDAKTESVKLTLMSELNKGQRIACVAECTVGVMYLQSGKEYVVKGPGEYLVGDNEVSAKIGVPPTMRDTPWRVSSQTVVQVAQTSSASIRMRGVTSAVKPEEKVELEHLLYPLQTKVTTLLPVFRWTSDNPKGPFEFELVAPGDGKPLYKAKTTSTTVKLPNTVNLQPDTEYEWTVKSGGKGLGAGRFKTLHAASMDLTQKRKPEDNAMFSDWLLYALTLYDLGAEQDAHEVWSKLAKERPDLPELMKLAK